MADAPRDDSFIRHGIAGVADAPRDDSFIRHGIAGVADAPRDDSFIRHGLAASLTRLAMTVSSWLGRVHACIRLTGFTHEVVC